MTPKRRNYDAIFYNWEIDTTSYLTPVIWGNVIDDNKCRFPDGKRIHTSTIMGLEEENILVTKNSRYKLICSNQEDYKRLEEVIKLTKKEENMSYAVSIFSEQGKELKQNKENAGYDLEAAVSVLIGAGERALVKTGFYTEFPENLQIEIRPRSGLALKNGITVLNTPGTIDSSYRGEIGVILFNTSNEDFQVTAGDRIAQAVFMPVIHPTIKYLKTKEELGTSNRAEGGFGSTGK
jgi:dUTP pyrophosphatase